MKKTYKNKLPRGLEVKDINTQIKDGELIVNVYFDFNPKDGDFLVSKSSIFIYKPTDTPYTYGCYCACLDDTEIIVHESSDWTSKKGCRYATPKEKSAFLERLEKVFHKKWNPEKKCLEDIYTPKFGDIIKVISDYGSVRNYMICIMPNKDIPKRITSAFYDIYNIDKGCRLTQCCGYIPNQKTVLASESEKQELFDKLAEIGKRWNPETKQLEDTRWRAKYEEYYFTISNMNVIRCKDFNTTEDRTLYNRGNYFRTPEAAEIVLNQEKELFKNSKAE